MPTTIEEYLSQPYTRILIPSADGSFSAEILEFYGCFSDGDTPNEALENLEKAAKSWLAACLEQGLDIPEPFYNQDFGGKIALRLPRSLHRQASRMAERDGVSLNQFLVSAISERIGAENLFAHMMDKFGRSIGPAQTLHIHIHAASPSATTGSKLEQTERIQIPTIVGRASNIVEKRAYA